MNPRDTAANLNRRRMIRRGATYGPPLPENAPEDGVERGIAAFVICASLIRQFEFAQWCLRTDTLKAANAILVNTHHRAVTVTVAIEQTDVRIPPSESGAP
jgi:deferrochelatase/peroxidase EfeB